VMAAIRICSRRKGQLAAFRDAAMFKVVYG
jgi:hypothetical protein